MILKKDNINGSVQGYYNSSDVLMSLYNSTNGILDLTFNSGNVYRYHGVSESEYMIFEGADSQGKAFNKFIKTKENERIDRINVSAIKKIIIDRYRELNS